MEGLDFNSILDDEQINSLFSNEDSPSDNNEDTKDGLKSDKEKNKNKDTTAEIDPDDIFDGTSKSVGSEENKDDKENTSSNGDTGTSPDFFSSIASAFAEEGIFPDLDEETIKNIKTPEDFRKAIDAQMKAELSEQQKRVAEALDNNVSPDVIRQHETIISYLDSIKEEELKDEGEDSENLRRRIIMQDYTNRGFSKERAEKLVNKAFENGTDVEEATEALESNRKFFKDSYKKILDDARTEREKEENENKEKAERIKKSILANNIKFFGDTEIDKSTRQKAFEAISKPIYRDPRTGETYTAVQKFELDNGEEFLATIGLIYALTDGFKSIEGLVGKKVKKEIKKGFSELENRINSTSRDSNGNLKFASGVNEGENVLGKGVKFDF